MSKNDSPPEECNYLLSLKGDFDDEAGLKTAAEAVLEKAGASATVLHVLPILGVAELKLDDSDPKVLETLRNDPQVTGVNSNGWVGAVADRTSRGPAQGR